MPNPAIVALTAGQWNLVATNVTTGIIHILDTSTQYQQTYRLTGGVAPTLQSEGAAFEWPGIPISSDAAIDVYVWPDKNVNVRVDL